MKETLAGGRYRVERILGHGGMAVVYLAHDEELQRLVAVKLLAQPFGSDERMRKRFLREARLAGRLSHPNVVRVYDAGETDGRPFIVMEYVPGRTLAQRGKLPADKAAELMLQACAGLQHAHEAGLVHRDVKPANFVLRDDGVLKVTDFGIARTADATRLTEHGTVLGTAAYLAPEQAAGEEVTTAADIYSLGAVVYELLTGRPPYQFESLAEFAHKQRSEPITPVRDLEPSVPNRLEALVMHCLAREPRFRPRSAGEVGAQLAATLDASTKPLPPRQRSRPRPRVWLIAAVAAAAALVAVLGVVWLTGAESPPRPQPAADIAPPVRGATPAEEARNLSAWLRAHARR